MARQTVTLTNTGDHITYCRLHNGAAFVDNDADATTVGGTPFELWADDNDWLYVGRATTFAYVGFKVGTAAVGYGNFTFQYRGSGTYAITAVDQGNKKFTIAGSYAAQFVDGSHFTISGSTGNDATYTCNGDASEAGGPITLIVVNEAIPDPTVDGDIGQIWTTITTLHNSVETFTVDGYISFSIPGYWTSVEIDSTTAYWIRATQDEAAPATPATAYHLMENVTLAKPVVMDWGETRDRLGHDIASAVKKLDLENPSKDSLVIVCTHLALEWDDCQLVLYWEEFRRNIYIEDNAVSSPMDYALDAYYRTGQGRLDKIDGEIWSPGKMRPEEYRLIFEIESSTSTATALGLTP